MSNDKLTFMDLTDGVPVSTDDFNQLKQVSLEWSGDPNVDYLGDPLPEGYDRWSCDTCTAVCNFEAMNMCVRRFQSEAECAFDRDQPDSNFGCFGFIKKKQS